MDRLTLPRLHPAIPRERASATAEALFLSELQRRQERGQVVDARGARSAKAAMERTLKRFFRPRGGLSSRFIDIVVVLDDNVCDENTVFSDDTATWAIYPRDRGWAFIGATIDLLEKMEPGAGETVLHALRAASIAVNGVMMPADIEGLTALIHWDEATDDAEATQALRDRGYAPEVAENRPLLPSELREAGGGPMWFDPQRRVSARVLRKVVDAVDPTIAPRLARLATVLLPQAAAACKPVRDSISADSGYYTFVVCIWPSEEAAGHPQGMLDDMENDRANSGESDVLFRCATDPLVERKGTKPRCGDGLVALAAQLWVYHYIDQTLCALVDLYTSWLAQGHHGATT